MSMFENQRISYGRSLRETEFSHHSNIVTRLNNGSFGGCPQVGAHKTDIVLA